MWDGFLHLLSGFGVLMGHLLLWISCLCALALSCVSISGTWLVVLLGVLSFWIIGEPGWVYIGGGILVSILVEVMEWAASAWGVRRRGGSGLAGWAALLGALLGMLFGAMIPPPLVGSLLGMLVGSFVLAYLVERQRMGDGSAVHVAMGAVMARIFILLVKIIVTLSMVAFLLLAIYC